jgi:serine protease
MEQQIATPHGSPHRAAIEHVGADRLGLERSQTFKPRLIAVGDPDAVPGLDELARDVPADETGGARHAALRHDSPPVRCNFPAQRVFVPSYTELKTVTNMLRRFLLPAAIAALATTAPAAAVAAPYVPGEVIVHYKDGGTSVKTGQQVKSKIAALKADPDVATAVPNYIAHAAALYPNDPGFKLQWNFAGPTSINLPDAWDLARARRRGGGKGVVVAVLDTGVAYERYHRFRRAPDLNSFVKGYDFVDGDKHPNDENGHGTHVAGTIAESTNNRVGAAGIAYSANIMPVRVLDSEGAGDTLAIARGIRYAAKHGAKIINMSLEFDASVRASQIPDIVSAIRYAHHKGVLVVAAAGNQGDSVVAYPARARYVMAVAATTIRGCQADYSDSGADVDIAAPGGGIDAANSDTDYDRAVCRPDQLGHFIFQQTFTQNSRTFGLPSGYEGTSMAAPHVSGVAALIVGSRRLGKYPSPTTLERRLETTARDIGAPGVDARYGHGLLDAAAALRP